ncbi:MAG: helix-turn-helix domain-containing protein [Candidatus Aenigmarchaeota archaeon]|nr:helix-turn-helix domain-containing protein [Candidatus Aenigmarchaeota archaeon]
MMDGTDRMVSRMIDFALEKPEVAPSRVLVINLSKTALEKVLTPSRIDLIREIRERKPKSVSELAELVKRSVEAVSRDLNILENYGLLTLVKAGKIKKPEIEKDILMIPLKS